MQVFAPGLYQAVFRDVAGEPAVLLLLKQNVIGLPHPGFQVLLLQRPADTDGLLGAGGLVRAYAHGAKIALDAAGRSMKRVWTNVYLPCPYSWYERVKLEIAAFDGIIKNTDFGADVSFDLLLPETQTQPFLARVLYLSAGTIEGLVGENEYRAFPLEQQLQK